MRIRYSQEADALYIRLRETRIEDTDEVSEDLIVDYDIDGNVVGLEILAASTKVDTEQLIIQAFNKVMVEHSPGVISAASPPGRGNQYTG